jgi:hypothetical protein
MRTAIIAIMALASTSAFADEVTIKLSDQEQNGMASLSGAMDTCVAGLQLRGDAAMCKAIAQFGTEITAKVKAAQADAAKAKELAK